MHNTVQDIECINLDTKIFDEQSNKECQTYVYGAYLPCGIHQALIYSPGQNEAYTHEFAVDLNSIDQYPEFPTSVRKSPLLTRANVWRKW